MDNSKCAILMPVARYIEPETNDAINVLLLNGYQVFKYYHCSDLVRARSLLATQAIENEYQEIIWIDSDTRFDPSSIEKLRSHGLPFVCGISPLKSKAGGFSVTPIERAQKIEIGQRGGLIEVQSCGMAFTYTDSEMYGRIKEVFGLPRCRVSGKRESSFIPYFFPDILEKDDGEVVYLGEDASFCNRARQCGYKIYVDTSIRLGHIGSYSYEAEDIGGDRPRYDNVTIKFDR